ncbi:MAG: D-alanyl-D-alanine endopeptidase [Steroidobacteraceae bacterium]
MRSIKQGLTVLTLTLSGLFMMSFAVQAATSQSAAGTKKAVAAPVAKSPAKKARKATKRAYGNPEVKSSALLVVNEDDSSVLLSKNADVPVPIASITKLMTALVVLEAKQSLDEDLTVTKDDRSIDRGAASRLAIGTTLSRGDLMHLALMASENRAAHALGRNYPGGIDAFLVAMNDKARALGMTQAHFADPTGLSSENVASPADLSRLVIAASRNATIRSYSTDDEHAVSVGKYKVAFRNTNNLVRNKDWDIVVSKTGYTEAAGRCLVMKTLVNDRPVVIVLLNSFGKYTRVADAARIRRWIETGRHQSPVRAAMLTPPANTVLRSTEF